MAGNLSRSGIIFWQLCFWQGQTQDVYNARKLKKKKKIKRKVTFPSKIIFVELITHDIKLQSQKII